MGIDNSDAIETERLAAGRVLLVRRGSAERVAAGTTMALHKQQAPRGKRVVGGRAVVSVILDAPGGCMSCILSSATRPFCPAAPERRHHQTPAPQPTLEATKETSKSPASQLINHQPRISKRPPKRHRLVAGEAAPRLNRCLRMARNMGCLASTLMVLIYLIQPLASALQQLPQQQQQQQQYFEVQPEPLVLAHNGHDVRLRCLVRNRQGECLWLRNGRAIGATLQRKYQFQRQPEDGDCSVTIRNVSVSQDDGVWQCQVTPSDIEQETLQSHEVLLQVLVAPERPQIKNTSQNTHRLVVEENKGRIVVCEMRGGNPAPLIEWMLEGRNVTKEAQLSSSNPPGGPRITQSKLKLSDIKRSMNGRNLTCVGVHPTYNQTASVELDVQYVPTVSVVQREYSVVEGSPLSISCQVDANPPPNTINWRLVGDGAPAARATGHQQQVSRQGPVLEFERISRDLNQNTFQCSAQNSYGISLPANVKLNVLYAPFLLNTSHSESVPLGSDAQLACIFDGNPEPEVKWHYTDPLARSAQPVQVANDRQQYLAIKNVTYRNEGDYHCEARNQINGVNYAVRSSNILLDVFGEPQFLTKSPQQARAVQGNRCELALSFCADPPPNKVYWQFGSLRLDVRLTGLDQQQLGSAASTGSQGTPGGSKAGNSVSQRYLAQPLQPLQKRASSFSKISTCFEAQLSILSPELTDQRDYTLVVQNERGHQASLVKLRVNSPLSPMLMISSAFVTICGLFLCSLIAMFLMKRRQEAPDQGCLTGDANGRNEKSMGGVEHLANGNGNGNIQQQTHGIINGIGNGMPNGSSNPAAIIGDEGANNISSKAHHLMSIGSSDCSSGDQKQLLAGSDMQSSASSAGGASNNHSAHFAASSPTSIGSQRSAASSTPSPMNHISVDDDSSSTYRAGDQAQLDAQLSSQDSELSQHRLHSNGLIYANLDYAPDLRQQMAALNSNTVVQVLPEATMMPANSQFRTSNRLTVRPLAAADGNSAQQRESSPADSRDSSLTSESMSSIRVISSSQKPLESSSKGAGMRTSVGATIALMNSLAAQAASQSIGTLATNTHPPTSGALSQQLANNRLVRKAGPPKPPKPNIQQRGRLFLSGAQQQMGMDNQSLIVMDTASGGGRDAGRRYQDSVASLDSEPPSANELAVEYSRIAFSARADL